MNTSPLPRIKLRLKNLKRVESKFTRPVGLLELRTCSLVNHYNYLVMNRRQPPRWRPFISLRRRLR